MTKKDLEVLRAAHVLRNFCKSEASCGSCPLHGSGCLHDRPEQWRVPGLEDVPEAPTQRKLKEIKTIAHNIDYMPEFDRDVNEALAEGWTLVKREVIIPRATRANIALYAELERYDND